MGKVTVLTRRKVEELPEQYGVDLAAEETDGRLVQHIEGLKRESGYKTKKKKKQPEQALNILCIYRCKTNCCFSKLVADMLISVGLERTQ